MHRTSQDAKLLKPKVSLQTIVNPSVEEFVENTRTTVLLYAARLLRAVSLRMGRFYLVHGDIKLELYLARAFRVMF